MNDRIEIGVWTSISDGSDYIGAFLNCGELGIEAYDADDVLIDVFADEKRAFSAISDCWDRKLQSNGGDPKPTFDAPSPSSDALTIARETTTERPMLAAALDYAKRGWDVFPAPPGDQEELQVRQIQQRREVGKDARPRANPARLPTLARRQCRHPDRRRERHLRGRDRHARRDTTSTVTPR